jgi:hypothetical protein
LKNEQTNSGGFIMKGIKKILFGIALILSGFFCLYASSLGEWGVGEVIGLIIPIVGVCFAIAGLLDKSE